MKTVGEILDKFIKDWEEADHVITQLKITFSHRHEDSLKFVTIEAGARR